MKDIIDNNLEKLVTMGIKGVYPFPFAGTGSPAKEYKVEAPIVCNQLVFSHAAQILSFLIMDLTSILGTAQKLFPKMARNESLKMVVSANNEILNSFSSKVGLILAKVGRKNDVIITPPLVMNQTGHNRKIFASEDSLFWTFRSDGIAFDFVVSIQEI